MGILPLESITGIHKKSLNLFSNIVCNKYFIEYEIAERQLVMKGCEEKSWFNLIKSILEIYNLASIFSLFNQQMSKVEWKRTLNNAVHVHIEAKWRADLTGKTSLKYINPNSLKVGKTHPIWSTVRNDSGYLHDSHADKNPYPHDRHADKDSYPHDSNNQCIILRLQLSFVMINVQLMLV